MTTKNKQYFMHIRAQDYDGFVNATGGATLLVNELEDGSAEVTFSIVNGNDNYCKAR